MKAISRTILLILLAGVLAVQAYNIFGPPRRSFTVCPVKAISMHGSKAVIDSTKCIGCRRCVDGFRFVPSKSSPLPPQELSVAPVDTNKPESAQIASEPTQLLKPTVPQTKTTTPAKSKKQAYHVDTETCIGCGLCTQVCPTKAITLVDGKAIIDKDLCINCGICKNGNNSDYHGCPTEAISAPR